jgi:hypothetical protein
VPPAVKVKIPQNEMRRPDGASREVMIFAFWWYNDYHEEGNRYK